MSEGDLPETWLMTNLGAAVDYGKADKAEPGEISPNAWILELEDIEKNTSRIVSRVIFSDRLSKSTKNKFFKGNVLYGKLRPYLNKVILADKDGFCTTEIIPLDGEPFINNRYLFYWLKHPSFLHYVEMESHGMNMPRLGTEAGKAAPFVLAPLAEQKRIADKLDTLLGQVDACRQRLERVPEIIKRFRQAVLTAATSGKLTEEWRKNGNVGVSWAESSLGRCGVVSGGLTKSAKRDTFALKKPYLRVANVHANRLDLSEVFEIGITEAEFQKTKLESGDLLIVEGNGSLEHLGRVAMWDEEIEECTHQNHLIRWRSSEPLSKWVLFWLLSPIGRSDLMALASTTTGLHTLSISKVAALKIRLPSLPEQSEIVRRVETLFAFADRLEARHAAALQRVEQLTPSLLAQAFRGELVAQDPQDEAASVLLAKIAQERTQAVAAAKPRKARNKEQT